MFNWIKELYCGIFKGHSWASSILECRDCEYCGKREKQVPIYVGTKTYWVWR